MNYDKLSRALRYYYDKNIMTKVPRRRRRRRRRCYRILIFKYSLDFFLRPFTSTARTALRTERACT